jgi:dTDP-glucose pyrophosphorylase
MIKTADIKRFVVKSNSSIREVLRVIDNTKEGIALVVDGKSRLLGTITDGDIRRFILKDGDINTRCSQLMNKTFSYINEDSLDSAERLMREHRIRHIPLLNKQRKLIKLYISDIIYEPHKQVAAVIMAGGKGSRLSEVTKGIPKPLMKINGKPILEEIITALKKHKITQIYISLNYKAQLIRNYFGNGSKFGVNIKYLIEKRKLGTAGALSLLPKDDLSETLLVVNGDVLTATNLQSIIDFHRNHRLLMCVAAKEYNLEIPFGVFDITNGYLVGIKEKPSQRFFCNAGIYVLSREIIKFIPKNKLFNMTDLVKVMLHRSLPIEAFPLYEYWIDIGNAEDYRKAKREYQKMFKRRIYE